MNNPITKDPDPKTRTSPPPGLGERGVGGLVRVGALTGLLLLSSGFGADQITPLKGVVTIRVLCGETLRAGGGALVDGRGVIATSSAWLIEGVPKDVVWWDGSVDTVEAIRVADAPAAVAFLKVGRVPAGTVVLTFAKTLPAEKDEVVLAADWDESPLTKMTVLGPVVSGAKEYLLFQGRAPNHLMGSPLLNREGKIAAVASGQWNPERLWGAPVPPFFPALETLFSPGPPEETVAQYRHSARGAKEEAFVRIVTRRYEEADAAAGRALKDTPNNPLVQLFRATTARCLDRTEEAEHAYRDLIKKYPDCWSAWMGLAYLSMEDAPRTAIEYFQRAVQAGATTRETRAYFGWAYFQAGQAEKALPLLQEVLREDPSLSRGWSLLAGAQLSLKHYPEALRAAKRALTTVPNDVDAIRWLAAAALETGDTTLAAQGLGWLKALGDPAAVALGHDLHLPHTTAVTFPPKVGQGVIYLQGADLEGKEGTGGTGFLIDRTGLIVTCSHMLGSNTALTVHWNANEESPVVSVVAVNPEADVMILKVDRVPPDAVALSLCPRGPGVGETLAVVSRDRFGRLFGDRGPCLGPSQSPESPGFTFRADFVERGMSGSPFVNGAGDVVGILIGCGAYAVGTSVDRLRDLAKARHSPTPVDAASQAYEHSVGAFLVHPIEENAEEISPLSSAAILTLLQSSPKNFRGLRLLVYAYLREGKSEEARASLRQALDWYPDEGSLLDVQAQLDGQEHRWEQARDAYQRIVAQNPRIWISHLNVAIAEINLNALEAAETAAREAERLNPGAPEVLNVRGQILHRQNKFPEALVYYRQVAKLQPWDVDLQMTLARLERFTGNKEGATSILNDLFFRDPSLRLAQEELGAIALEEGRHAEAAAHFRHAWRLAPDDGDLLLNLITTSNALGETNRAEKYQRLHRHDHPEP